MNSHAKSTVPIHRDVDLESLKAVCTSCSLRELCVPGGMSLAELEQLETLVALRRRVKRGNSLYRVGDTFKALYAVRNGFFKMCMPATASRDQVSGFQIPGEVLGLDGLSSDYHTVDAFALEDSEVCVLPYAQLNRLTSSCSSLQHQLHRVMSREIVRDHSVMLLLGSMRADERVAAFLLNLSERYEKLGYSPNVFVLRMTRADIGSYLGMKIETVSRSLSNLQNQALIDVQGKKIRLLDTSKLRAFMSIQK